MPFYRHDVIFPKHQVYTVHAISPIAEMRRLRVSSLWYQFTLYLWPGPSPPYIPSLPSPAILSTHSQCDDPSPQAFLSLLTTTLQG